jgi:hypothetical protein
MTRVLGMVCVLAMATVTGFGPVAAQETTPLDKAQVESLCAEHAQSSDDFATCLDIVKRILVPPPGTETNEPAAASDTVTASGQGDESSDAFVLAGGDYLVTLVAKDTDGDGYICYASALLKSTGDNSEASRLRLQAAEDASNEVGSYFYSIPAPLLLRPRVHLL